MQMLQGVWKQHLMTRAVVGYGVKIFLPSPPNYVTRSPGVYSVLTMLFKTKAPLLLTLLCDRTVSYQKTLRFLMSFLAEFLSFLQKNKPTFSKFTFESAHLCDIFVQLRWTAELSVSDLSKPWVEAILHSSKHVCN